MVYDRGSDTCNHVIDYVNSDYAGDLDRRRSSTGISLLSQVVPSVGKLLIVYYRGKVCGSEGGHLVVRFDWQS